MKTLDEVIFEVLYMPTPWEENAIYYLKEYCNHMKNEIIELQQEVKKQKEMIEFLEKPLTWQELQAMEGKPVWLEDHFQYDVKKWCIVERIVKDEDCEYIILEGLYFPKDYLGKEIDGWQAYRKERL